MDFFDDMKNAAAEMTSKAEFATRLGSEMRSATIYRLESQILHVRSHKSQMKNAFHAMQLSSQRAALSSQRITLLRQEREHELFKAEYESRIIALESQKVALEARCLRFEAIISSSETLMAQYGASWPGITRL